MSKHTPGPWFQSFSTNDPMLIKGDGGYYICRVSGSPQNAGSIADAQLIAAAPDLLEALKTLWGALPFETRTSPAINNAVRAAIAKAEGR
jgi:hypothetical protein